MIKIILILTILLFASCENEYKVIKVEIIRGVVSYKENGNQNLRYPIPPCIYIQNTKDTRKIELDNTDCFKIGDSVLFVLQQVEKIN